MAKLEEKTSWLDEASQIDQETVDLEEGGYPYIQWVNGDKRLKSAGGVLYTGGWAMPTSQVDDEELEDWTKGVLTHDDGSETAVFTRRDITIAPIRSRKCWVVYQDNSARYFPWDQYDEAKATGNPRGKLQVLCVVKSMEERGPYMLTLRGSFAQAFWQKRGASVMGDLRRYIVDVANKANRKRGSKAKFPYRAFWLTAGSAHDANDVPIFTKVGSEGQSSMVTLPVAMGLSDKLTMEDIGKRFVGGDLLTDLTTIYTDAESWAHALDEIQAEPEAAKGEDTAYDVDGKEIPF